MKPRDREMNESGEEFLLPRFSAERLLQIVENPSGISTIHGNEFRQIIESWKKIKNWVLLKDS